MAACAIALGDPCLSRARARADLSLALGAPVIAGVRNKRNKTMPENSIIKTEEQPTIKTEGQTAARRSRGLIERLGARYRTAPALLTIAGILLLVVSVAYWFWPRPAKRTIAVDTPPMLEARQADEAHDEHSQEG